MKKEKIIGFIVFVLLTLLLVPLNATAGELEIVPGPECDPIDYPHEYCTVDNDGWFRADCKLHEDGKYRLSPALDESGNGTCEENEVCVEFRIQNSVFADCIPVTTDEPSESCTDCGGEQGKRCEDVKTREEVCPNECEPVKECFLPEVRTQHCCLQFRRQGREGYIKPLHHSGVFLCLFQGQGHQRQGQSAT